MSNPIHRRSVDRFMAMADGREEVSVLASEYDVLESENEALRSQLTDALNRQTCEGGQPYVCHALATARSRLAEAEAREAKAACTRCGCSMGVVGDVDWAHENAVLRARLAEVDQANERFAIRVLGQEAYDNSPCQAHPLELVEVEIESLRLRLAEEVKNKKEFERDWLAACDELCNTRSRLADWHRMADERSAEIVRLSTRLAEVDAALAAWGRNEAGDAATIIRIAKAVGLPDSATHRENERD